MAGNTKEVDFHTYCAKCEYKNAPETDDICDECLAEPSKIDSKIPVNYKEKK